MFTLFELKQIINKAVKDAEDIKEVLNIDVKNARITEIDNEIAQKWSDVKLYATLSKEKTMLTNIVSEFQTLQNDIKNIYELLQLPDNELDDSMIDEINNDISKISSQIKDVRMKSLFNGKTDSCNAFLEINSGAGG